MPAKKILVVIGSLRTGSFNRKAANALMALGSDAVTFDTVEIGNLPFFNEDLEQNPPAEWVAFRERITNSDAVLFFTPEYNRSVPGVLKNALDVGSRPYGQNAWDGLPAGVVSVSISPIGGFGANHHLRQSLMYLNMPTMPQPELYIPSAGNLFDESGAVTNQDTKNFLQSFFDAFLVWTDNNRKQ
ncbi:MAG: NADPH-dependent oxidoreductase [Chitinophagaceae bacterium]|nr:MAG: NADPH-dependent oxidoreductase [Chitinophagaceae bacterium]